MTEAVNADVRQACSGADDRYTLPEAAYVVFYNGALFTWHGLQRFTQCRDHDGDHTR